MPSSIKTLARQRDDAFATAIRVETENGRLRVIIQQVQSFADVLYRAFLDYNDEAFAFVAIPEEQEVVIHQMHELLAEEGKGSPIMRCALCGRPPEREEEKG